MREGEGIAAGVLESLGVNLGRVRAEITRILVKPASPNMPNVEPMNRLFGLDRWKAAFVDPKLLEQWEPTLEALANAAGLPTHAMHPECHGRS